MLLWKPGADLQLVTIPIMKHGSCCIMMWGVQLQVLGDWSGLMKQRKLLKPVPLSSLGLRFTFQHDKSPEHREDTTEGQLFNERGPGPDVNPVTQRWRVLRQDSR